MDKRMVISAYRKGFITIQECAQIMGIDSMKVMGLVNDPQYLDSFRLPYKEQPVNH